MSMSEEEKKELVQFVLDKKEEGKIVVMTFEGLMSAPLEDFIKQPADGLLYDLNRDTATTLSFVDDPKWVNDFAVALVIRKLKAENERLRERYYKLNASWLKDSANVIWINGWCHVCGHPIAPPKYCHTADCDYEAWAVEHRPRPSEVSHKTLRLKDRSEPA